MLAFGSVGCAWLTVAAVADDTWGLNLTWSWAWPSLPRNLGWLGMARPYPHNCHPLSPHSPGAVPGPVPECAAFPLFSWMRFSAPLFPLNPAVTSLSPVGSSRNWVLLFSLRLSSFLFYSSFIVLSGTISWWGYKNNNGVCKLDPKACSLLRHPQEQTHAKNLYLLKAHKKCMIMAFTGFWSLEILSR